ncbi:MAG: hypothetical protein H7318_00425 [Oligoflexus sp.]|nr:hypothetical protein [Oligoflexus sp.]
MEPSSDLEQLNSFLKSRKDVYDLPKLEAVTETKDFLEEALHKVMNWLSGLFKGGDSGNAMEDGKTVLYSFLIMTALAVVVLIAAFVYRALAKGRLSPKPVVQSIETPPSAASLSGESSPTSDPLSEWLRGRWKAFLQKKGQRLSLTPSEYSQAYGRPDQALVTRINESMFWKDAEARSRDEWETFFQGLEREG